MDIDWYHAIYYLVMVVGAMPLGYLVMRLSYPEIRVFDAASKAGYSFVAGFVLVVASVAADVAFNGATVAYAEGFLPLLLVAAVAFGFAALWVVVKMRMPEIIDVGIPSTHPGFRKPKAVANGKNEEKAVEETAEGDGSDRPMESDRLEKELTQLIQTLSNTADAEREKD